MSLTIYGIPTCNTCKKARKWLTDKGISHTWVNLRDSAPTQEQCTQWVTDLTAKPLKNTSGGSYRALGEEKQTWSDAEWALAFANDPMLLKRPVVVKDGHAIFTGFKGSDEEIALRLNI